MQSLRDSPPRQSQFKEVKRLKAELAEVTQERDDYRDTVDALLKDCDRYLKRIKELEGKFSPEARDQILASLGIGKQSPQYKRVRAVLDQMMHSELPIDSLVEPLEDDIDTREKLSELGGEVLSDLPTELRVSELPSESFSESPSASPLEEPTGESTDELLLESPMEGKSEVPNKLLSESLRHMEMARRLDIPKSTLSDIKKRPHFPQWSKERDPDAIAWTWDATAKVFVPVDVPPVKTD